LIEAVRSSEITHAEGHEAQPLFHSVTVRFASQ
jgi:hypothetical protein